MSGGKPDQGEHAVANRSGFLGHYKTLDIVIMIVIGLGPLAAFFGYIPNADISISFCELLSIIVGIVSMIISGFAIWLSIVFYLKTSAVSESTLHNLSEIGIISKDIQTKDSGIITQLINAINNNKVNEEIVKKGEEFKQEIAAQVDDQNPILKESIDKATEKLINNLKEESEKTNKELINTIVKELAPTNNSIYTKDAFARWIKFKEQNMPND